MIRTQVQLTDQQIERLRRMSAASGRSIATLVRDAVDRSFLLDESARLRAKVGSVAGKFRSRDGADDVSARHDDYLGEAFGDPT